MTDRDRLKFHAHEFGSNLVTKLMGWLLQDELNDNLFNLGVNRTVDCRVTGARPTPTVKWFNNDYEIRGSTIQVNFYIKLSNLVTYHGTVR